MPQIGEYELIARIAQGGMAEVYLAELRSAGGFNKRVALKVLMPPYAGLVVLGVLLVVCYAVDRRAYRAHGAAAWLTLRFRATVVASLSCFVAAALS